MRNALAILIAVTASAQTPTRQLDLPGLSRFLEQIVAQVSPGVVQILARGITERSSGSGVVVDPSGYIVTNAHVVGLARRLQVLLPVPHENQSFRSVIKPAGKLVPATLVGVDRETDLAVLKVDAGNLQSLKLGDSESLRQGQLVFAFGSPFGLENSVTMGIVSSPARQVQPDGPMIYVQTDAPINPGNSGGPLIDAHGAVVGINTFIVSPSGSSAGVGFAAPSNIVRSVYEQIRKNGSVRRGEIGVGVQTVTPTLATALGLKRDWGVMISDVAPSSSAEAAGLEIKDIIVSINGKTVENARQFEVNIYSKAGETVTLELLRGASQTTKQVAVLERPADKEQLLSKLQGVVISRLGIFAVDLDEKVTPLLPTLRALRGVVVATQSSEPIGFNDPLLPGDVIYSVDGNKVGSVKELDSALSTIKPGQSIALQLERQGQLRFAVVEVQ